MIKKQIIIGLIAIVVVIILILSVVVVIFGSDEDNDEKRNLDSRFFGIWKEQGKEYFIEFKSNNSIYLVNSVANIENYYCNWKVNGDMLCFYKPDGNQDQYTKYEFSNNDTTLTLYGDTNNPTVFNKQ